MTEQLWTWVEPGSEHKLNAVQNAVTSVLPDAFEAVDDFHISILPGVTVPAVTDELLGDLDGDAGPLTGRQLTVDGLRFFPEEEPHVVMLDVSINGLQNVRDLQTNSIEAYDGELQFDPVPAHITLAKAADGENADAGLTNEQITAVRETVSDEPTEFATAVTDTHTETF